MSDAQATTPYIWSLMGQAETRPSALFDAGEMDLWPYRRRTSALLRRYARASVEVGRLPSLLGREFFRSRVTSYTMRNFEDVVIFVADMERAIKKLDVLEKKLLAMNILEEYTIPEVARLLGCNQRMVERHLQDALDQLSRILLAGGLMEKLPLPTRGQKTCQEGKNYNFDVSDSNKGDGIVHLTQVMHAEYHSRSWPKRYQNTRAAPCGGSGFSRCCWLSPLGAKTCP